MILSLIMVVMMYLGPLMHDNCLPVIGWYLSNLVHQNTAFSWVAFAKGTQNSLREARPTQTTLFSKSGGAIKSITVAIVRGYLRGEETNVDPPSPLL